MMSAEDLLRAPARTAARDLLSLIDDALKEQGWSDAELELRMGWAGKSVMEMVRSGVVQFSCAGAYALHPHVQDSWVELLRSATKTHLSDAFNWVVKVAISTALNEDGKRLVESYLAVANGDEQQVVPITLPGATVWIAPTSCIKPEQPASA